MIKTVPQISLLSGISDVLLIILTENKYLGFKLFIYLLLNTPFLRLK
jgi:hypothetical protein